jgi:hypothetical protein
MPPKKAESAAKKQIVITEISTATREDELELNIGFRLLPSKNSFSSITAELFFDDQKIHNKRIKILPSSLVRDELELPQFVLGMKGIEAGTHRIKVKMFEQWDSEEKLTEASKEITVYYIPVVRVDRLIKVPIVKSVAGEDLAVVSDSEKEIYREINESMKQEESSKRDEW